MYFGLTADQIEIKQTARAVLAPADAQRSLRAPVAFHDEELWSKLVELGWAGILVPEELGGAGLGVVEAMCLAEEIGYALAPVPYLWNTVAISILVHAGSPEQQREWLAPLAAGDVLATVGLASGGRAEYVADAPIADLFILVDGTRGSLLTRATADVTPISMIDQTRGYASVAGEGQPLALDPQFGLQAGAPLVAAELVGIAQRALAESVRYGCERHQFGKPIGAFQAVAHRCADMLVDVEAARSTAYHAAWAADASADTLGYAAALALVTASDAARRVPASAIQVHGGVGFTWEAGLHWLLKRAHVDAILLGPIDQFRTRIAQHVASAL